MSGNTPEDIERRRQMLLRLEAYEREERFWRGADDAPTVNSMLSTENSNLNNVTYDTGPDNGSYGPGWGPYGLY